MTLGPPRAEGLVGGVRVVVVGVVACGKTLILPTIANHQSRPECEEILRQTETLGQEVVNEVEASIERKVVHSVDGRGGTKGARHTSGRREVEGWGGGGWGAEGSLWE